MSCALEPAPNVTPTEVVATFAALMTFAPFEAPIATAAAVACAGATVSFVAFNVVVELWLPAASVTTIDPVTAPSASVLASTAGKNVVEDGVTVALTDDSVVLPSVSVRVAVSEPTFDAPNVTLAMTELSLAVAI